jgi:uncharacterized repeat protein (TIGR01451 family)
MDQRTIDRRSRRRALACALSTAAILALCVASSSSAATPGTADLRITKTAGAGSVQAGSTLTYTIRVENLGPDPATGVTVTDKLPQGVDFVSATSTAGQCGRKGRTVTCAIGALEAGQYAKVTEATVSLAVIPRKAGTLTNTAEVKGDQKDPRTADNRATVSTAVVAPTARRACRGQIPNIVGTPGADVLLGTPERDVILAFGGADRIASRGGRDLVCAGRGRDAVFGGAAGDRLFGGAGADRLFGRRGRDVLRGGRGFDLCRGGPGLDRIRGCER